MTTSPSKIVIRTPNWLGDLMMSTAFIHAVLDQFPDSQVDLIVKSGLDALPLPHRGKLYVFDKKQQSAGAFGASLKSERYDRFYVLPPSFSSAWMALRSRTPERIGYVGNVRKWLLYPAKRYEHPPRTQHLVNEYLGLLDLPPQKVYLPQLTLPSVWIEEQLALLDSLPSSFLAFATGAIFGPAKKWPIPHYKQLADWLVDMGKTVVLLGTQADFAEGESIRRERNQIQNWCGKTNLCQLVAVLSQAQMLVSNDSGAMHIMAALQRPQIAIFGSTSPIWTAPLNELAQWLQFPMDCAPCFQKTCQYGHYHCLKKVTPEQVLEKL